MEKWNPEWETMPWKTWSDPVDRFNVLPSFVLGEFLFIGLTFITLGHAIAHGKRNVAIWIAAFAAGTTNDAFFMALPIVDNFWQSQACIMLTPRMPLYIPCVYNVFMYCGAVCGDVLNLPILSASCLAGILGEAIYSPYDITGAKFLWWTWHDTDAPVREKILGAPVGSTVWVITFTCSFHFIFNLTNRKFGLVLSVLLTSLLSTPFMMLQMAGLQLVSGDSQGLPTSRSLIGVLLIYAIIIAGGTGKRSKNKSSKSSFTNNILLLALILYYSFLSINMAVSHPEKHLSTGVHQEVGDCSVRAADITGHLRQVYLCKETQTQDFTFDCEFLCDELGATCGKGETSSWYTVCGRAHTDRSAWLLGTVAICTTAATVYTYLLGFASSKKKTKSQ